MSVPRDIAGFSVPVYTSADMTSAIGIDIGGTFIDIVFADGRGVRHAKIPSTPGSPASGVLQGLRDLIASGELDPPTVDRVIHGSTVATNALLEGTWGRIALVTTRGFRDVLEIGRQSRPHLFDLHFVRPEPIVPRDRRFEVDERLDCEGREVAPLCAAEVATLVPVLRAAGVDAVAIVFLFSFLDPRHEREAGQILSTALDVPVVLSCDVLPEFREYERTSTTAITAALRPVVGQYISVLEEGAAEMKLPSHWQIMQSSGAVTSAAAAEQEPARILLSGPAGGVEGARAVGKAIGVSNLITMDMGGTSCDIALIRDGRIGWSTQSAVGGHPVALPMVEIHTIGAGGGSIAWVDRGGALRVGPESAGADPGPACYGRGGRRPTVTDAHLILGHLLTERPIGGLPPLDRGRSKEAIRSIAEALGSSIEQAALGILEVSDAAMEHAIRVISVERGHDPRDFWLLPFGGAGPLHAVSVARRLSIPRVVVPASAGVLSACGLLTAEMGHDFGRSVVRPLRAVLGREISGLVGEMCEAGREALIADGCVNDEIRFRVTADLRYVGQSHELNVAMAGDEGIGDMLVEEVEASFHEMHEARFGHAARDEEVELITLRVRAYAAGASLGSGWTGEVCEAAVQERDAWFGPEGPTKTRLVDRSALAIGEAFNGPAIVLGTESTLVVPPGTRGERDRRGNLLLEVR